MFGKLKKYILIKLGIPELRYQLEQQNKSLNDKIDFLSAYINLSAAEDIIPDEALQSEVREMLSRKFGIREFEPAIHKNDVMFAYHLFRHRQDPKTAILDYFRIGAQTAVNLSKLTNAPEVHSILDFGSGYGRVSRFLPKVFPSASVETSEVKAQSLNFQNRHFGYRGHLHTQDPATLSVQSYDLILALSVFTHLPKKAFEGWLKVLIDALSENGSLVFTYNDSSDPRHQAKARSLDFKYDNYSEDSSFNFLYDSMKDGEEYGNTYVSRTYLSQLLQKFPVEIRFAEKSLVDSQEVVIVQKISEGR